MRKIEKNAVLQNILIFRETKENNTENLYWKGFGVEPQLKNFKKFLDILHVKLQKFNHSSKFSKRF